MIFIHHRINTVRQLEALPTNSGCEIDLRSNPESVGSLILSHDAWTPGESFEEWLEVYAAKKMAGPLILNTKEDGLEEKVLSLLRDKKIDNFFFLDTTIPTLVKWTGKGISDFAVRYSTFEPLDGVLKFRDLVKWIWVDCFQGVYPSFSEELSIFKICLVSPELQGLKKEDSKNLQPWLSHANAVCTKQPNQW